MCLSMRSCQALSRFHSFFVPAEGRNSASQNTRVFVPPLPWCCVHQHRETSLFPQNSKLSEKKTKDFWESGTDRSNHRPLCSARFSAALSSALEPSLQGGGGQLSLSLSLCARSSRQTSEFKDEDEKSKRRRRKRKMRVRGLSGWKCLPEKARGRRKRSTDTHVPFASQFSSSVFSSFFSRLSFFFSFQTKSRRCEGDGQRSGSRSRPRQSGPPFWHVGLQSFVIIIIIRKPPCRRSNGVEDKRGLGKHRCFCSWR